MRLALLLQINFKKEFVWLLNYITKGRHVRVNKSFLSANSICSIAKQMTPCAQTHELVMLWHDAILHLFCILCLFTKHSVWTLLYGNVNKSVSLQPCLVLCLLPWRGGPCADGLVSHPPCRQARTPRSGGCWGSGPPAVWEERRCCREPVSRETATLGWSVSRRALRCCP